MNIIDGLQKKKLKIVERIVTTICWLITIGYVSYTFLSAILYFFNIPDFYHKLFGFSNIYTTLRTLGITVCIAIGILLLLYVWGKYNYKKYAHLSRRTFPKEVTNKELEDYLGVPSSIIEKMKKDKIVVLEKTIL
jgi:poly-beta-1,6-N-acetyl-D-glucosamine biosynthesis protein PgaD